MIRQLTDGVRNGLIDVYIHVIHGYMQKLQILFPDPQMRRMREVARRMDLPVSEIVRRATEGWLEKIPSNPKSVREVPVIQAGRCLMKADKMRDAFYE